MFKIKKLFLLIPLLLLSFLTIYGLGAYKTSLAQPELTSKLSQLDQTKISNLSAELGLHRPTNQSVHTKGSLSKRLHDLQLNAIAVSQQFPAPGEGTRSAEGLQKLLQSDEGHCGHFVYVFARQLQSMGYRYKIYGVTGNTGAAHAFVQAFVEDEWVLFDPSNGLHHRHTLEALLDNPDLATDYVGQTAKNYEVYATPNFFGDINQYYSYENVDLFEQDVMLNATVTASSKFVENEDATNTIDGMPGNNYTIARENGPAFIDVTLEQPETIYRLSFTWLSDKEYPTGIKVENITGNKASVLFSTEDQSPKGSVTRILLKEPVAVEKLKFSFWNYQGNDKLMVREISAFRY